MRPGHETVVRARNYRIFDVTECSSLRPPRLHYHHHPPSPYGVTTDVRACRAKKEETTKKNQSPQCYRMYPTGAKNIFPFLERHRCGTIATYCTSAADDGFHLPTPTTTTKHDHRQCR